MPEKTPNEDSIDLLRTNFSKAHSRYVEADIDHTLKKQALFPLREALTRFENTMQAHYLGAAKTASEHLLLRLRSVNLLIEGFYWIGSYDDAKAELERFGDLDEFFRTVIGKSHNGILIDLAGFKGFKEAAPLLRKLATMKNVLVNEKTRIVQELIRTAVNTAVVRYYVHHNYEAASTLLELCRMLALSTKSEDGEVPYRLLAQIDYFTACAMRQVNRLSEADDKLHEVVDHYLDHTDTKRKRYLNSNRDAESRAEFERSAKLARYRAALTLMARCDLNRRLGKLSIALYANLAVARIILLETNDTINLSYARMLFAIISREMYATEEDILHALEMIKESQDDFKQMGHTKYLKRSIFEEAYTLYYLARLYNRTDVPGSQKKAREKIAQAIAILTHLQIRGADPRWKGQYLTLEGRLLILQLDDRSIERAGAKLGDAIKELSKTERHKTYLVEARIAMSRVLMEKYVRQPHESYPRALLNEAEKLLVQAQRENADANGVPENNKIEAIIDFALARIKIRQGLRSEAEAYLMAGSARLPVIDSDGVKRLFEFAQRELSDSPLTFQVSNDLNMNNNIQALQRFIIEQADKEEKIRGQKPWKIIGIGRSTYFELKGKSPHKVRRD